MKSAGFDGLERPAAAMLASVLPAAGFYLAGTLALAYRFGGTLFCSEGGCASAALDPRHTLAGLPFSAYGAVAFLALWIAAVIRAARPSSWRLSVSSSTVVGLCAVVVSLALLGYMAFRERTVCLWCCSSAAVFAGCLLSTASLIGSPPVRRRWCVAVPSAAMVLAVAGLVSGQALYRPSGPLDDSALSRVGLSDLAPADAPSIGPADSGHVVVMFSDFECPFCRREYPEVRNLQASAGFRLVFRHFPLPMHTHALLAARLAEMARGRGAFWDFADACFASNSLSSSSLRGFLVELGFDRGEIDDRLAHDDECSGLVQRDVGFGQRIGLRGVPVLVLVDPGKRPRVVSLEDLARMSQGHR